MLTLEGLSGGAIAGIVCGIVFGLILIIAIVLVGWYIKKANYLRRMQVKIKESASDIDVALTKRFDLLTKQYDITKGYAKHENDTLIDVAKMRSNYHEASSNTADASANMKDLSKFNAEMDKMSKSINIVVERYPELKANTMFINLSNTCADVEEHLQAARRLYNSNVSIYNQEIVVFPSSIVANHIHATPIDFFEAEEAKRQDVKMEF
ncbi:MAG: LemA family protein [Bacilli bacterium]|jgi:LemA protein